MIAAALLTLAVGQSPVATLPSVPAPPPVGEWPTLPLFPLSHALVVDDAAAFVRGEVETGRCQPITPTLAGVRLEAPVAILVGTNGMVRQIVPRAIGCPTVEQYTVGYLLSLTRRGSGTAAILPPGWYRLTIDYRW